MTPKLARDVLLNNWQSIHLLLHLLLVFKHVVFSEVLDILWMNQVFLFRVLVVVLLEMVDLVLILVVTMVAWSEACNLLRWRR